MDFYTCECHSLLHCVHCAAVLLHKPVWEYKPWFIARVVVSHMQRKHPNVVPITRIPVSRSAMYRLTQE